MQGAVGAGTQWPDAEREIVSIEYNTQRGDLHLYDNTTIIPNVWLPNLESYCSVIKLVL